MTAEFFQYNLPGRYWDYVYSVIKSEVYGTYYRHRNHFRTWHVLDSEPKGNFDLGSEWAFRADEFFRGGETVSLRFFEWSYYRGTPHPNHSVHTRNLGGEDLGAFGIGELLKTSQENLEFIIDYCDNDLRRQLGGDFKQGTLGMYADHQWALFEQFNFDETGLTFNFSPYDILPYVFGSHEVSIPWSMLRNRLTDEFRSSAMAGRFHLTGAEIAS